VEDWPGRIAGWFQDVASGAKSFRQTEVAERRSSLRFPVIAELEYEFRPGAKKSKTGRGVTVNLSGTGVLFHSDKPLPPGIGIYFSIKWPTPPEDRTGIRLVGIGNIVRVDGNCVAIHFTRHEFQTRLLQKRLPKI
jgi:hypothetical protein